MKYELLQVFAVFLLAGSLTAQDWQTSDVKGELQSDQTVLFHGYVIELKGITRHESWQADVMSDGSFTLREIPGGDYVLRVTTYQGGTVKEELVSVREHTAHLEVKLPREEHTEPGGPVSVRELQHPPSAKAIQAAVRAQKFESAGDRAKAIEELQKAVKLSPDFAAAHTNLGAEYLRVRHFAAARHEIEQALAIGGPNAVDLCNLAMVDAAEQRIPGAVASAQAALRVEPDSATGHYLLGSLLALDKRTAAEGMRHLEQAAATLPAARQALNRLRAAQTQ